MSIYGKKNLFEQNEAKSSDKHYVSTLHVLDKTYIPPYTSMRGEDMQKVMSKEKAEDIRKAEKREQVEAIIQQAEVVNQTSKREDERTR